MSSIKSNFDPDLAKSVAKELVDTPGMSVKDAIIEGSRKFHERAEAEEQQARDQFSELRARWAISSIRHRSGLDAPIDGLTTQELADVLAHDTTDHKSFAKWLDVMQPQTEAD